MSFETVIKLVPRHMIWRLEYQKDGRFHFLFGRATAKGNFSRPMGLYSGYATTAVDAIWAALTSANIVVSDQIVSP